MNAIDWIIVAIVGVSALVGLVRGAAYELFALGGWVAAVIVARTVSPWLAQHELQGIENAALRDAVAWAASFGLTLLAAGLAGTLLRLLLRSTGLGLVDRSMGGLFGVVRGVLLVLLAVFAARYTSLPGSAAWRVSVLVPVAGAGLRAAWPLLPVQALPQP